jgi:hypothetical protein
LSEHVGLATVGQYLTVDWSLENDLGIEEFYCSPVPTTYLLAMIEHGL